MNRWDEIQAVARDIATNVHSDPEQRDAMADDLIKLVGLMIGAVGKGVAVSGEEQMNESCEYECSHAECDRHEATARYTVGEDIQNRAREAVHDATSADLERYSRPTGTEWCVCGHHPDSHMPGRCIGVTHNKHACTGGPCTQFRVKLPEPVWQHKDRRPAMFRDMDARGALYIPPELAEAQRDYERQVNEAAVQRARDVTAQAVNEILSRPLQVSHRHCNCCDGPCNNRNAVSDPAKCCHPLGSVCPIHC